MLDWTMGIDQRTYFVSSSLGDDSNTGTQQNEPWKTFANFQQMILGPGDRVLLRGGDEWIEEPLHLNSTGTAAYPTELSAYADDPSTVRFLCHIDVQKDPNNF
jgi:hypothetical protein